MMKTWTDEAWEDFCYWEERNKRVFKKIKSLLKEIDRNGYEGIGKPEPLRDNLSGYWSRRIDDVNRLVYKIEDDTMKIVQCGGHYQD